MWHISVGGFWQDRRALIAPNDCRTIVTPIFFEHWNFRVMTWDRTERVVGVERTKGKSGSGRKSRIYPRGPNLISTRKMKIWQHRLLICNTILGSPAKSIAQYRKKKEEKKEKKKNLPSDCSQKIPKVDQKYQESSKAKIDTKIGGKCSSIPINLVYLLPAEKVNTQNPEQKNVIFHRV